MSGAPGSCLRARLIVTQVGSMKATVTGRGRKVGQKPLPPSEHKMGMEKEAQHKVPLVAV